MLITRLYFQNDITIPNINEIHSDNAESIDILIESEVSNLLESVLGIDLFEELKEHLDDNNELKEDAPEKWQRLVYGHTYESNNKRYRYKGLLEKGKDVRKSLLADYVFVKWLKGNVTQSTGVGQVIVNAKNAMNVNPSQKLVAIWNRFYNKLNGNNERNRARLSFINCTPFVDWYGSNNNSDVISVFRYLQDFKEDFETVTLSMPFGEDFGYKNQLGI